MSARTPGPRGGAGWRGEIRTPRRGFRASPADEGRPLLDFLSRRCPEVPAGFLKKLVRKGYVLVEGGPARPRTRLEAGQRIVVSLPPGAFLVAPNPEVPFRVVYEDEHLVVVDKPAGVVSEPGIGHKLDTLLNGLIARYGEALDLLGPRYDFGMVHRLDRDASGLVVVARSREVQRALAAQFRRRSVDKRYLLLVWGDLTPAAGEVRLPVARTRRGGRAVGMVGGPGARQALTRYRVIERFGFATLVEARPVTGRWRQIRLHFSAIRHPIAGDTEHGDPAANDELRRRCGLDRLFLHATRLRFRHPANNRWVAFTAPLPRELDVVLRRCRGESGCARGRGPI